MTVIYWDTLCEHVFRPYTVRPYVNAKALSLDTHQRSLLWPFTVSLQNDSVTWNALKYSKTPDQTRCTGNIWFAVV